MIRRALIALAFLGCCAGRLPSVGVRALDNSGDPCNGCKLYTYDAGTTDNKATYSDDDLTSANANPVVASSSGIIAEVYLLEDECYKFVLKSSDDATTYWTEDNVCATQLVNSSVVTRFAQLASDPLTQGAAGDGTTDDATELQAAFDAAQTSNGIVDLLGKTYRVGSALSIPDGVTVQNGIFDLSQDAAGRIQIHGSSDNTGSLDGNEAAESTLIEVSDTTNVDVGDIVFLRETSPDGFSGELQEVVAVVASTSFTVAEPTYSAYDTANGAGYTVYDSADNVGLRNIKILADSGNVDTGLVSIQYAQHVVIEDLEISGYTDEAIQIVRSRDVTLDGVRVHGDQSGVTDIAIKLEDGNRDVRITDCTLSDLGGVGISVGLADNGAERNITIENCTIQATASSSTGQGAITLGAEAQNVVIRDNTIIGATSSSKRGISSDGSDVLITGNVIRHFVDGCIVLEPAQVGETHGTMAVVNNPMLYDCGDAASDWAVEYNPDDSVSLTSLIISGNGMPSGPAGAVSVTVTGTSESLASLEVRNNSYSGSSTSPVTITTSSDQIALAVVAGNSFLGSAAGTVLVDDVQDIVIANNVVDGLISVTGSEAMNSVAIVGNTVLDGTGISVDCSHSGGIEALTIAGNTVTGSAPVDIEGYVSAASISGNVLSQDDDTNDTIDLAGDAGDAIARVSIAGNVINNGAYGISVANTTQVSSVGNVVFGYGTFVHTGTIDRIGHITFDDLDVGSCNVGDLAVDTATGNEICACDGTNWFCAAVDDTTGPAD